MKILLAGIAGSVIGLLLFAIGREVWFAFQDRPAPEVLGAAFHWLGSFRWLLDYQTLISVVGAGLGVYAQIAHAERVEHRKNESKRRALRSVLPFTLSSLSDYAIASSKELRKLIDSCVNNVLPKTVIMPEFGTVPPIVINSIRDFIEVAHDDELAFLSLLPPVIQIQQARLEALSRDHLKPGHITLQLNLDRYIVDAAEVYALASALFQYARSPDARMPTGVTRGQVGEALGQMGIYDDVHDRLVSRYDLEGAQQWVPPFARSSIAPSSS